MSEINTARWNQIRYTAYAPFYDLLVKCLAKGRRRAVELLALQPGEKVLIVGAGTGLDLEYLPEDVDVTAVDITPAMVRRTVARARELNRPVSVAVMNAENLGFAAEQFDCVLLHLILAVVPDPFACAREAERVLKPHGRVSVFDKFLPDDDRASRLRQGMNLITGALFSDINRQLKPLLQGASMKITHHELSSFGGAYRVATAIKN